MKMHTNKAWTPTTSGCVATHVRWRAYRQQEWWKRYEFHKSIREAEIELEFDSNHEFEYTREELGLIADKILWDNRDWDRFPILFRNQIKRRYQREIYNVNGVPDPEIVSGIYWRAHPQGRKLRKFHTKMKRDAWYAN